MKLVSVWLLGQILDHMQQTLPWQPCFICPFGGINHDVQHLYFPLSPLYEETVETSKDSLGQ